MNLVVNLVRTVSSAKFVCCCWRIRWCDCHVTHRNVTKQPKYRQIINRDLTILIVSVFPVLLTNFDKAQIWHCWQNGRYFYKTLWQPCTCQQNELKREIRKKLEGQTGGQAKSGGAMAHPAPPLESPLFLMNSNWKVSNIRPRKNDSSLTC